MHDMPVISVICHNLEERINEINSALMEGREENVSTLLVYVDLISKAGDRPYQGQEEFTDIEKELRGIKSSLYNVARTALMVEPSPVIAKISGDVLARLSVHAVVMKDGMEALSRLLHDACG